MELKEFVSATLSEIQAGVQAAIDNTLANKIKGAINPCWGSKAGISQVQNVQFDIAVTASETTAGGAEGGIKVVGLSMGGEKSNSKETNHVSRIQFSIPVIPPISNVSEE